MKIDHDTRILIRPGQSSSVLGTETIVLHYEQGNYYELNEIGGFIWSLLQTNQAISVREIKDHILSEFAVEESICQAELLSFLESLYYEKLIQTSS